MKPINLILMMGYCLIGVLQMMNPTPIAIFFDILMILILMFFYDSAMAGWGRASDGWSKTLDMCINLMKQRKDIRNIKSKGKRK